MNDPQKMIGSSSSPLMTIDLSKNTPIKLLMEWGRGGDKKKPLTLYDYNISLHISHSSIYMTTRNGGATNREYFH